MRTYAQKTLLLSLLFISIFALRTLTASAQSADLGLQDSDVSVSMNPETPAANKDVTVSLTSYSIDMNRVTVIWKKEGQTVKSGIGAKSLVVRTSDIGSAIHLDIQIFSGGDSITKNILIQPSEVDLLWESPDSYVPPFYKGKALPASESTVVFTAIPNTARTGLSQNDMFYTWEKNYTTMPSSSGYKKGSLSTTLDYLNPSETVSVAVSTLNGQYNAENIIEIAPSNPKVLYYENNPSLGIIFDKALFGSITTTGDMFEVIAVPFFFSANTMKANTLSYSWTVGGKSISSGNIKNSLTVQFPKGVASVTAIVTDVESKMKLFQTAQGSLSVTKK